MTPEQQAFLDELEADLASPVPSKQLGLNGVDGLTIADATEALTQTISLVSQLPLASEHRARLIQQSQEAYQHLLLELSGNRPNSRSPQSAKEHENPSDELRNITAGKVMLTLLAGGLGLVWSVFRVNPFTLGVEAGNVLAAVFGGAICWVTLSVVAGLRGTRASLAKEGAWLCGVIGLWTCMVYAHQLWSAGTYVTWFGSNRYDARAMVWNDGLYDIEFAEPLALLIASFILNCMVCAIVDKVLAAGHVSGARRLLCGVGIVVGIPVAYGFIWNASKGDFYDARMATLNSSAIAVSIFLVAPVLASRWAEKRGLFSTDAHRLLQWVGGTALASMVLAMALNPFMPLSKVKDRVPNQPANKGDWLYELSLKGSGSSELIHQIEGERDEALELLLSRMDDVTNINWPDKAQPFDYDPNGNGTWYRESAVKMLLAKGITGPVRE